MCVASERVPNYRPRVLLPKDIADRQVGSMPPSVDNVIFAKVYLCFARVAKAPSDQNSVFFLDVSCLVASFYT